jgi:hypothetical protein
VLSDPSTDGETVVALGLADVGEIDTAPDLEEDGLESGGDGMDEEDLEDWEAELDKSMQGPKSHIHNWSHLRKQIKAHLKKNSKSLPLSPLNQFLIISNFATLHIKGLSRTQASLKIA